MLRHGSIFSGIGGFDLAAELTGWQNVFSCEKHPFARQVLNYYWPDTTHYDDIFHFDATQFRGHIDIITGGFPCQPFSLAGKRRGSKDDRYLWPQASRIITEAMPRWIVLENVAGLFTILEPDSLSEVEIKAVELFCQDDRQPANTTVQRLQRRVIGNIISEIGTAGYVLPQLEDGTPIVLCIPACAVGAPHRRDRLWFVAHADTYPAGAAQQGSSAPLYAAAQPQGSVCREPDRTTLPDLQGQTAFDRVFGELAQAWKNWPSEPAFCCPDDGLPQELDGVTFLKWREESIAAYGNAIVPQVALEVFHAIQQTEASFNL